MKKEVGMINFKGELEFYEPELNVGDARDLSFLQNNSVDLICAHPQEGENLNLSTFTEYLKIVHKYILVYEVIK